MARKNAKDTEMEAALEQVSKEIEENNLQSPQPVKEKKMAKKTAKKSTKKTTDKPVKVVAGYTAKDLAGEFNITPAELRKALRAIKAEKPGKSWAWEKKTDKGLVAIRKELKTHFKDADSKPKKEKAPAKKAAKKEKPAKKEKAAKKPAKKKKVVKKKKVEEDSE